MTIKNDYESIIARNKLLKPGTLLKTQQGTALAMFLRHVDRCADEIIILRMDTLKASLLNRPVSVTAGHGWFAVEDDDA